MCDYDNYVEDSVITDCLYFLSDIVDDWVDDSLSSHHSSILQSSFNHDSRSQGPRYSAQPEDNPIIFTSLSETDLKTPPFLRVPQQVSLNISLSIFLLLDVRRRKTVFNISDLICCVLICSGWELRVVD